MTNTSHITVAPTIKVKTLTKVAVEIDPHIVCAVILVPHNLIDVDICGKSTCEWVKAALEPFKPVTVDIKRGDDIVSIVKDNTAKSDAKYCVVAYADTPLLTTASIEQALSFTATYNHKAVQLPRGWVFDMAFVRSASNVDSIIAPNLKEDDFTIAYNFSQIATINTFMRARINERHMQNGVYITDPYSVYIDNGVTIGVGTKINSGVVITGTAVIGNNVNIGANCNIINNVKIGDNAQIEVGSTITQDVPNNARSMARAKQFIQENFRKDEV